MEYDQANAHMDDCLALVGNCHQLYMSLDDSLRRIANQAFFDRLYVQEDNRIEGQLGDPFNILTDPDIQRLALRYKTENKSGNQTQFVASLNNEQRVPPVGLEPTTHDLKGRCSTIELKGHGTALEQV